MVPTDATRDAPYKYGYGRSIQVINSKLTLTQMADTQPHHEPFPSIEHFRKAKDQIKKFIKGEDNNLNLRGTVKLHGSHADIVYEKRDGKDHIQYQSRNRILTKGKDQDNCGFAKFMDDITFQVLYTQLIKPTLDIYNQSNVKTAGAGETKYEVDEEDDDDEDGDNSKAAKNTDETKENTIKVMLSGEFCGGNIQKGVALTQLPKMFVIFAVKINEHYEDLYAYRSIQLPDQRIYSIFRVEPFRIPFSLTDSTIPDKLQIITDKVERECPFAKSFNVVGTGEGVVWCLEPYAHRTRFWFKVKGEEHKSTRVITLKVKSTEEKAALQDATNIAILALPKPRLQQGLDYLREQHLDVEPKNLSEYLKFIVSDVLKEEADEINEAKLDVSALRKALSGIAKTFYFTQVRAVT